MFGDIPSHDSGATGEISPVAPPVRLTDSRQAAAAALYALSMVEPQYGPYIAFGW